MPHPETTISLQELTGALPGVLSGRLQGSLPLIQALRTQAPLPESCLGLPLHLSFHPHRAPTVEYPLWVFWLAPHFVLEAGFHPLSEWKQALAKLPNAQPILVIARAEGRWKLPHSWDLRLSALLHERDASGIPNGRALFLANPTHQPATVVLRNGLSAFVASLDPTSQALLPEASVLIRSGRQALQISANAGFELHPTLATTDLSEASVTALERKFPERASAIEIPTPARTFFCASARFQDPLLWGAWRSGFHIVKFITATSRAANPERTPLHARLFRSQLAAISELRTPPPDALAGESADLNPSLPPPTRVYLERLQRSLERNLRHDSAIRTALDSPYQILHQQSLGQSPTLSEVASFPLPIHLPGDGSTSVQNPLGAPRGFVSFSELLARSRDVSLVAPIGEAQPVSATDNQVVDLFQSAHPQPAPGTLALKSGFVSYFRPASSTERPNVKQDDSTTASRSPVSATPAVILHHILLAATASPDQPSSLCQVRFQVERPRHLALTLLPELLTWATGDEHLLRELPGNWEGAAHMRLSLTASIPPADLAAWSSLASVPNASKNLPPKADDAGQAETAASVVNSKTCMRAAAVAMQKALRTLLAVAVLPEASDAANGVWTRALLVHRHAHVPPAAATDGLVADPRADAVLEQIIRSAGSALRRKSATWQAMQRSAVAQSDSSHYTDSPAKGQVTAMRPAPHRIATVFAEDHMQACLRQPAHLRKILLEESEICHLPERVLRAAASRLTTRTSARTNPLTLLQEAERLAGPYLRSLQRIYPGGAAASLASVLLVAANGAIASAVSAAGQAAQSAGSQWTLELQGLSSQGEAIGASVVLRLPTLGSNSEATGIAA